MAEIREKIDAEFENLERVVQELPVAEKLDKLSTLELSGVAVLVHNFYNGIENILKQMALLGSLRLPEGPSWHSDLLTSSFTEGVISDSTKERLKEYLGFRHFFSHAYAFDLETERLLPLAAELPETLRQFKEDIEKAVQKLAG
jgi:uncharacterized protein YutE (UPF0331/DUF86 family)